jgi:hypothetical protein
MFISKTAASAPANQTIAPVQATTKHVADSNDVSRGTENDGAVEQASGASSKKHLGVLVG